jgi:methionyl-tRNA formyltransferase
MKNIRMVFMGTPSFAVPILEALIEKYNVVGVVTQPDSVLGDKTNISPIKEVSITNNIKVIQPENIKKEFYEVIDLKPDIIITCAYGQIIPSEILRYPRYGCINVHASLLPELRGGAPIHRAIMNGYEKTGITIMFMEEKMDTGDIISQVETVITDEDNVGTLHDRLSVLGKDLLMETLPKIFDDTITRTKQDHNKATYAWNIKREDEKIDFDKNKKEIFNKIRALNPSPGAYCIFDGKVCKVWNSRLGDKYYSSSINGEISSIYEDGIGIKVEAGEIIITEIQLEGKKRMTVKDFLNGIQDKNSLIGKILE